MEAYCRMVGRETELVAELRHLLFPSPTPTTPASHATSTLAGECLAPGLSGGGRRRGRKRVRRDNDNVKLLQADDDQEALVADHGDANAKPLPDFTKTSRRKQQATTSTMVTTVPDFDGYQWRKYGHKQIEGAMYPRSYYRCTNSTNQGCLAKKTVQRNDDDINGGGGAARYTVAYISEHTCKPIESSLAPVILDTTVRTSNHHRPAAPCAASTTAAAQSPATSSSSSSSSSDMIMTSSSTWSSSTGTGSSGETSWSGQHGAYCRQMVAADEDYRGDIPLPTTTTSDGDGGNSCAEEMAELLSGPIRSPVHIAAGGNWMDDLLRVSDGLNDISNDDCSISHFFSF